MGYLFHLLLINGGIGWGISPTSILNHWIHPLRLPLGTSRFSCDISGSLSASLPLLGCPRKLGSTVSKWVIYFTYYLYMVFFCWGISPTYILNHWSIHLDFLLGHPVGCWPPRYWIRKEFLHSNGWSGWNNRTEPQVQHHGAWEDVQMTHVPGQPPTTVPFFTVYMVGIM